ncbi:hypothetical protein ECTW15901_2355, partial [Escherichia coli TW15901]
DDNNHRYMRT